MTTSSRRHTYRMGIVGNCTYMAHVDDFARIVWLCWPRFDSSFVFGRMLDRKRGGEFSVYMGNGLHEDDEAYGNSVETKQYYIENTNVLCTEIRGPSGAFRVTDFAPRFLRLGRFYKPLMLIRRLEPVEGSPVVRVVCNPKGSYGTGRPDMYFGSNHLGYVLPEGRVRLTTDIPLNYIASGKTFVLDYPRYLVMTWGFPFSAPIRSTSEEALRDTVDYWRQWVRQCSIGKFFQNHLIRSALALKLHQFEDTGAIIASATTSLPEAPLSGRTWDYRYCWLRDTYYTLSAFNRISHFDEMEKYSRFVENIATASGNHYSPLVDVVGEAHLEEQLLELEGYLGNGPVRIGNQAYVHKQNDIYGQILLGLLPLYLDKRFPGSVRTSSHGLVDRLLRAMEANLDEPDNTLWEFRDQTIRHCYTALFHWAGSKAAMKITRSLGDREMYRKSRRLVIRSARRVEACYDEKLGAYCQSPSNGEMDASLLQLITMRYLDPGSERAAKHLRAIEERLRTRDGLMYRYLHADDFGFPETTFLVCAFWYVEALADVGRLDDALVTFERLLSYSNHLGLLSEDVDERTGGQWGNFPQTYSHVGLMNAAFKISSRLDYPDFF